MHNRREVLVTGAAGFIGGHVFDTLQRAGLDVVGVDTSSKSVRGRSGTHWIRSSASNKNVLGDIGSGRFDVVVHQAAIANTLERDELLLRDVNVSQAIAIADACSVGRAKLIYASSHSVYGRVSKRVPLREADAEDLEVCSGPLSAYARSKRDLDAAMISRSDGLEWIGLRYTNVFGRGEESKGPMASMISQMLRRSADGKPLRLFDDTLDACRDYVPVGMVCQIILALVNAEIPVGVYNFGSGIPISFSSLIEWCSSFAGAMPVVELVPNLAAAQYQYWTCADMSKLRGALKCQAELSEHDVRDAAMQLFRSLA